MAGTVDFSQLFVPHPPRPNGCWAAYAYDDGPYLISAHPTELEALRKAVDQMGRVVFLPWDTDLRQAIHAAEEAANNA